MIYNYDIIITHNHDHLRSSIRRQKSSKHPSPFLSTNACKPLLPNNFGFANKITRFNRGQKGNPTRYASAASWSAVIAKTV
jgi:hypothetical protein